MSFVESAICRMSPFLRGNLQRRLTKRVDSGKQAVFASKPSSRKANLALLRRAHAMLGRFSALTAGLEVR